MEGDERYGTAEIWLQMQGNREDTEDRVVLVPCTQSEQENQHPVSLLEVHFP